MIFLTPSFSSLRTLVGFVSVCGYAIYHLSRHYPFYTRSPLSYNRSISMVKRGIVNQVRTPDSLATVQDGNHWTTMAALSNSTISHTYDSWCPVVLLHCCPFVRTDSTSSCRAIRSLIITSVPLSMLCSSLYWISSLVFCHLMLPS